jgi:hypothetical protein
VGWGWIKSPLYGKDFQTNGLVGLLLFEPWDGKSFCRQEISELIGFKTKYAVFSADKAMKSSSESFQCTFESFRRKGSVTSFYRMA